MPAKKKRKAPQVGTTFSKTYKGRKYSLKVVRTGDGVRYELGGKVFSSLSGAAKSITLSEVNGWVFWGME